MLTVKSKHGNEKNSGNFDVNFRHGRAAFPVFFLPYLLNDSGASLDAETPHLAKYVTELYCP